MSFDLIGQNVSFIRQSHVAEYDKLPVRPLAAADGHVLCGEVISMHPLPPINRIPTYECQVRSLRNGNVLTVNSTLQYLRKIDG